MDLRKNSETCRKFLTATLMKSAPITLLGCLESMQVCHMVVDELENQISRHW